MAPSDPNPLVVGHPSDILDRFGPINKAFAVFRFIKRIRGSVIKFLDRWILVGALSTENVMNAIRSRMGSSSFNAEAWAAA